MGPESLHLPPTAVEVKRWVLDCATQLQTLRSSLREAIAGWSAPTTGAVHHVVDKALLVATELAANALKHGRPPTIVRLYRTDTHFIIDVADHDPSTRPHYAQRPAGAGGLGLRLVRKLAVEIGWYVTETTKHVWARFPVPVT